MTRVVVDFEWEAVGAITLEGIRPVFPRLPEAPGLYRFAFEWADRARGVYAVMGATRASNGAVRG